MKKSLVIIAALVVSAYVVVELSNMLIQYINAPDPITRKALAEIECKQAEIRAKNEVEVQAIKAKYMEDTRKATEAKSEADQKVAEESRRTAEVTAHAQVAVAQTQAVVRAEADIRIAEVQSRVAMAQSENQVKIALENRLYEEARAKSLKEECAIKTLEAESQYEREAKEQAKRQKELWDKHGHEALQLINHVNFVVAKILHYNDPVVLEREYSQINQNALNLSVIHDAETIDTIKAILDVIVSLRIDAKDRQFLQEDLDDEMAENMRNAMPDVSSLISVNPWQIAANVASAAVSGYMNYQRGKKKLLKKHKKAEWELDKAKMKFLNELNKELLVKHWALVEKYQIKDEKRVVEDELVKMINRLKDPDLNRKINFLKQRESTYGAFPTYWYYRAQAVYDFCKQDSANGDALRDEVLDAIEKYERTRVKILRKDRIAALVAMMKIEMLYQKDEADEIRKQCKILIDNATDDDWNFRYFAALAHYDKLGDKKEALRILTYTVEELEFRRDTRLVEWKGALEENTTESDLTKPEFEALSQCRSMLTCMQVGTFGNAEVEDHMMLALRQENTAEADKLFMYSKVNSDKIFEFIKNDAAGVYIGTIARNMGSDEFYVNIPYKWLLRNDEVPVLRAINSRKEMVVDGIPLVQRLINSKNYCEVFRYDFNSKDLSKGGARKFVLSIALGGQTLKLYFDLPYKKESVNLGGNPDLHPTGVAVGGKYYTL